MAYSAFWPLSIQNSNSRIDIIPPFSSDGNAKPQYFWGVGNLGNTAIKQSSADRVREILSVLDFFSAPFGTQEYVLLNYGIEGTDFKYGPDGNPIPTANGFYNAPCRGASLPALPRSTIHLSGRLTTPTDPCC